MCFNNQHSDKQGKPTCDNNQLDAVKQYELIINARNFHYHEFNVWSTYFSVIVGALFVAYLQVAWSHHLYGVFVSFMGFVASLCWYLSAKGYTYWWNHWSTFLIHTERKIDKKETNKLDGVYSSFCVDDGKRKEKGEDEKIKNGSYLSPIDGANISTSKIVLLLTCTMTIAWLVLLIRSIYKVLKPTQIMSDVKWLYLISIGIFILMIAVIFCALSGAFIKSDMSNHTKVNIKNEI